jgi:hypothetical protein
MKECTHDSDVLAMFILIYAMQAVSIDSTESTKSVAVLCRLDY